MRAPARLLTSLATFTPLAMGLFAGAPSAQLVQHAYLKASNPDAFDLFAGRLAMDGDTLVVGASGEKSHATGVDGDQADDSLASAGAAYVFVREGSGWVQQAYLKPSNTDASDGFGRAVAISGDTIAIGSPFEDGSSSGVNGPDDDAASGAGAVFVFTRSGSTWTQQAYLKASNTGAGDAFGISVALDGETLVAGAFAEDSDATTVDGDQANDLKQDSGAAYVFVRSGTTWSQQAYLKAANADASDNFGQTVALEGDWVFVAAPDEDSQAVGVGGDAFDDSVLDAGAVYAFRRAGTSWSQASYFKASNTEPGQDFGVSLAVSQGTLAVGAPRESHLESCVNGNPNGTPADDVGGVFLFELSASQTWIGGAYVKASNPDLGDTFGGAVAIDGDVLVVGATSEDGGGTGVDGPDVASADRSGAAYTYRRTGSTWSCESYLKASNTGADDLFGASVAVRGGTLVVGASGESSASVGVNGLQLDDGLTFSGAAYVFDGTVPGCGAKPYGTQAGANYGSLASSTLPVAGSGFLVQISSFESGSPGGSLGGFAWLALSGASSNSPGFGGTVLVDAFQSILGPGVFLPVPLTQGDGELVLPLPATAGGLVLYAQAIRFDSSQPAWLGLTNGLEIAICP